jgi:hypothetical protein
MDLHAGDETSGGRETQFDGIGVGKRGFRRWYER